MLLDGGILSVCNLVDKTPKGATPDMRLALFSQHYYGERTVGYGRQYAAKGVNEQVDILARIWQDRTVRIGMYAMLDTGEQFRITNVQHLTDDDGLRVTDLSLQRLDDLYDVDGQA